MSNIIWKQIFPANMQSTLFRCSGLTCPPLHLPSTVPSSYLMVIKMKLHCPTHGLPSFADHSPSFLFNIAYRKQKCTPTQQMGEKEDCSTWLQPHTCTFDWCQYNHKLHLYWLQRSFPSFYLSTGAMNQGWDVASLHQGWDVASLQIRTHKLLLLHGLMQQKGENGSHSGATLSVAEGPTSKALQAHPSFAITCAFKASVVWPFLNNIHYLSPVHHL